VLGVAEVEKGKIEKAFKEIMASISPNLILKK
jgi:hypothetical protein